MICKFEACFIYSKCNTEYGDKLPPCAAEGHGKLQAQPPTVQTQNQLLKRNMWTKNVPQKEGHYWVQANGNLSGKDYVHLVKIYSSKKDGKIDTVFSDGENFSIDSDMFVQWYSEEITMPDTVVLRNNNPDDFPNPLPPRAVNISPEDLQCLKVKIASLVFDDKELDDLWLCGLRMKLRNINHELHQLLKILKKD